MKLRKSFATVVIATIMTAVSTPGMAAADDDSIQKQDRQDMCRVLKEYGITANDIYWSYTNERNDASIKEIAQDLATECGLGSGSIQSKNLEKSLIFYNANRGYLCEEWQAEVNAASKDFTAKAKDLLTITKTESQGSLETGVLSDVYKFDIWPSYCQLTGTDRDNVISLGNAYIKLAKDEEIISTPQYLKNLDPNGAGEAAGDGFITKHLPADLKLTGIGVIDFIPALIVKILAAILNFLHL